MKNKKLSNPDHSLMAAIVQKRAFVLLVISKIAFIIFKWVTYAPSFGHL